MEHIAVDSNLIASLAYDGQSAMQVLFRRGGLYQHDNVTLDEFEKLLNPGPEFEHSVGTAYNAIVKGQKPGVKIERHGNAPKPSGQPVQVAEPVCVELPRARVTGNAFAKLAEVLSVPAEPERPVTLPAEAQELNHKSLALTEQAQAIEVVSPVTQAQASEILLVIASMRKEIETTFQPMKDAAHKAHKVICDQERLVDGPLATAERLLKDRIGAYVLEQRRLAREAEGSLRKAEQERAKAEAKAAAMNQAIEQAIELESRGELEAAQVVLANPAPVPVRYVAPAPVAPAVAQVKGVSTRTEWTYRILDTNAIPREYLTVNESAIAAVVKRTFGKVRIPGIEAFETTVTAASRGRR